MKLAIATAAFLPLLVSCFSFLGQPCQPRIKARLWGKVKRGKLGSMDVDSVSKNNPKSSKQKQVNKKKLDTEISPALAAWIQQTEKDSANAAVVVEQTVTDSKDDETTVSSTPNFESFTKKSKRRVKQPSAREMVERSRDGRVDAIVARIVKIMSVETKDLSVLLTPLLKELLQLPTTNFRQLTAGSSSKNYRLAWVGSDDALCHIGTGLHKVPLARLQEVFISLGPRNVVMLQEVIRILGPFPNVKNVLQGTCKLKNSDDNIVDWNIAWDSMMDGTGKEILAGKEENVKKVDLQVYFSDPSILVSVVPPEEGRRADPFAERGKHVLVFVAEEDLHGKLEALRVPST